MSLVFRNQVTALVTWSVVLVVLVSTIGCGGSGRMAPVTEPAAPVESKSSRGIKVSTPHGVFHVLEKGQTLYALHQAYGVPVARLMEANGIKDASNIPAGTPIFIPGSGPPVLAWPVRGRVTSRFGPRGKGRHDGLDIDGESGDTIRAAASGRVLRAERDGRYGKVVLIDHGQGLRTLYAHASKLLVKRGDRVKRGQPIAEVGKTGNASGTHLHFEALRGSRPVDPLPLLNGRPAVSASHH